MAEVTRKEVELIKKEEAKLEPFEIIMFRRTVTINLKLALTMVDGNDTPNEFDNNEADDVDDRGAYANRDIIVNNLTM
ncbi:hypothetical protein QE152_g36846 [Popillia japonica]|uniref:Uncharacterized protein n=1 Tax=Popillia japonica TaxID=7064 RepID=A0AAW1ICC8_POPJA